MPVIPALGKLRQEDKLEASLDYIERPCSKTNKQNSQKGQCFVGVPKPLL
jgi:hypothetical protein